MGSNDSQDGRLRALLYAVQFESPLDRAVEHLVSTICEERIPHLGPTDAISAIEDGLASTSDLSSFVSMGQSDEEVRRFLSLVAEELKTRN